MPASAPPPSSKIPGKSSGAGPYVIGFFALGGLVVALFAYKKCSAPPPMTTPQVVTVTASATQDAPVTLNAPPPPPKLEDLDAGDADAGKQKVAGNGPPGPGPCGKCEGTATGALQSSMRSTAQSAQGCYQRALRTSAASGQMTVAVQVSSTGSVCSVSVPNDQVGSSEIRSCVIGKFQGRSFPPPTGGCVMVSIPINFKIKE